MLNRLDCRLKLQIIGLSICEKQANVIIYKQHRLSLQSRSYCFYAKDINKLYGAAYKFSGIASIFCYFFIERIGLQGIPYSFRDVSLSWNGTGRDAGHFFPFRDCPGQSGTAGHCRPRGQLSPGAGLRGRKISDTNLFYKLFFNSQRPSLSDQDTYIKTIDRQSCQSSVFAFKNS